MTDHLEHGAVTVRGLSERRATESEGVHGQGYGVGEKSWKRMEVVPPVSSLSPTLKIYTHQFLGKTKVPACHSVVQAHPVPTGQLCPGPQFPATTPFPQQTSSLPFQMLLIKNHQHLIKYACFRI